MIFQLAGTLGVYWGDWTLRELSQAWEGKMRCDWGIASSHMALLANANRDPKKTRPFKPADFNPMAEETKPTDTRVRITPDNIHLLRSMASQ